MKSILRNGKAETGAQEHVRRPVIAGHETGEGHGKCRTVTQHARPGLGIFVGQHRRHCPGKDCVSAWKRGVDSVVLEEVSVTVALVRTLAAGNKLHWRIDQESVDQGFQFEFPGFSGVMMLGLGSVKPYSGQ